MDGTIHLYDKDSGKVIELNSKDLEQKLDEIVALLKAAIQKFKALEKDLGDFKLKSFDVSLDLKGTIFVVTADGSIKLSFGLPDDAKK